MEANSNLTERPDVAAEIIELSQGLEKLTVAVAETAIELSPLDQALEKIIKLEAQLKTLSLENDNLKLELLNFQKISAVSASTGPKLTHATKGRVGPRGRSTLSKKSTSDIETIDATAEDQSHDTITAEPQQIDSPTHEEEQATKTKRVVGGGGFNLFGGFNPNSIQLRSSRQNSNPVENPAEDQPTLSDDRQSLSVDELNLNRSSLNVAATPPVLEVDEEELKVWIVKMLDDEKSFDSKKSFKDSLKDGQVLLKVLNATVQKEKPSKVNTGRFPFMHMENINNFIKMASVAGVPKQYAFITADLYEGNDIMKVLQCLTSLKKITEELYS